MSKIKFIAVAFLLFSSLLFTSCEDEPIDPAFTSETGNSGGGGNGGGVVDTYYMKVTKDGVLKQWNTTLAFSVKGLDAISITGSDGSTSLTLGIFGGFEPKVYPLEFTTISCKYLEGITNLSSNNFPDDSDPIGDITITSLDKTKKTIKGTFNFIGKNQDMTISKVFTKGEFFVKYTEQ